MSLWLANGRFTALIVLWHDKLSTFKYCSDTVKYLNRWKTRQVIFSGIRKKQEVEPPLPLLDITRDTSLIMLGVMITGNFSASDHIWGFESSATAVRRTPFASYEVMAYVTLAYRLSFGLKPIVVAKIYSVRVPRVERLYHDNKLTASHSFIQTLNKLAV